MSVQTVPLRNNLLLTVEPEPEQSTIIQVQKNTEGLTRFGRVTAVGPEVRDVKPGDRVLASLTAGIDLEGAGTLLPETSILSVVGEA